MFAATTDENGAFRISIRRIRTIKTYTNPEGNKVNIEFVNRAAAKACADELNETDFDLVFDKYTGKPQEGVEQEKVEAVWNTVIAIIIDYMN